MDNIVIKKYKSLPKYYRLQLISLLVAGLCGAFAYSVTTKMIYSNVYEETLSVRMLISEVIGVAFAMSWLVVQDKLFSKFIVMSLIEIFAYGGAILYALISYDFNTYLLLVTLIGAFVSNLVSGGMSKIHEMITDDLQARTDYRYFQAIVVSFGGIIGSLIALCGDMHSSSKITVVIAFIGLFINLVIEDAIDIYIYDKVFKKANTLSAVG